MDYYYKKYVESVIYDLDIISKISDNCNLDFSFLKCLKEYIDCYGSTIDNVLKQRILDIISFMRFKLGYNNIVIYNNLMNEILSSLNNLSYQSTLEFYYNQATFRAHDSSSTSYEKKMEVLFDMHDEICMSISYDYEIMKDLCLPSSSFDLIYSKYISNGWFLCSVKGMYAENRDFFMNPVVLGNLKKIILANDKVSLKSNLCQSCKEIKRKILKK